MFAKAEADVNKLVAELGESAPMKMPETAYFLSCIYAYIGKKVTTVGELKEALTDVKAMMTREYKTFFRSIPPRIMPVTSMAIGPTVALTEPMASCTGRGEKDGQPLVDMRCRPSSSRMTMSLPWMATRPSAAKLDSVRMAFEVVILESEARSSRVRWMDRLWLRTLSP